MTNFANALPRRLYRAAQIQQLDRVVIEEFSITGFRLMQTAGAAAFNALLEQWPRAKRLLVFTGAGKNGGDGYIVAGLAKDFGMMVEIIQVGERAKCTGDAKQAFEWAEKQQVTMTSFADFQQQESIDYSHTIMVDALLGTGLNREVTGEYKLAIELDKQCWLSGVSYRYPFWSERRYWKSDGCRCERRPDSNLYWIETGSAYGTGPRLRRYLDLQ